MASLRRRRPLPVASPSLGPFLWSSRSQTAAAIRRSVERGDRKKSCAEFLRTTHSLYLSDFSWVTPAINLTPTGMRRAPGRPRPVFIDRFWHRGWPVPSVRAQRAQLRRRYKEGQEDQLGALGLVVNAIVLWNTRYMDAVLSKLQADGDAIADADARRLSPLVHKHLDFLGRYHFSLPGDVRGGELRELRDPNAGLEEEWLLPVGSP